MPTAAEFVLPNAVLARAEALDAAAAAAVAQQTGVEVPPYLILSLSLLLLALSLLLSLLLLACRCACCSRKVSEPLLPTHLPRSDGPVHPFSVHEGRVCRASAYSAAAAALGSTEEVAAANKCSNNNVHEGRVCRASAYGAAMPSGGEEPPARACHNVHEGRVCRASAFSSCFCDGTAPSGPAPATAPNDASPPRNGSAPKPQQERVVCVSDTNVEVIEGGRGGGWGDLGGFPETITVSRQEHPTSRRGGELPRGRRESLELGGPPSLARAQRH